MTHDTDRQGPEAPGVELPDLPRLRVVELGNFVVNYDQTMVQKLAVRDPKRIGWRQKFWCEDEQFPDTRTGQRAYRARAVLFGRPVTEEEVIEWCRRRNVQRATPKEGIDIALASPRPRLDHVMPLLLGGQHRVDPGDGWHRSWLRFNMDSRGERCLVHWYLGRSTMHAGDMWELILEEIPMPRQRYQRSAEAAPSWTWCEFWDSLLKLLRIR